MITNGYACCCQDGAGCLVFDETALPYSFHLAFIVLATKHNSRSGWYVKLQPTLAIFLIYRVVIGEMTYRIICQFVAAIYFAVGIEHHFIASLRNDEPIVGVGMKRREVEDEEKVASGVCENLVAVVVPHLHYWCLLEILDRGYCLEHGLVEVAKITVAQLVVVDKIPLPSRGKSIHSGWPNSLPMKLR